MMWHVLSPPSDPYGAGISILSPSPAKWPGPVFLAVFLVDSKCLVDLPKSASHIGTSKLGKPELNSVGNRSGFPSTPLPFPGFPHDEFTISIGVLDIYHLILSMFMINPGKPSILLFSSHWKDFLGEHSGRLWSFDTVKFLSFAKRSHPVCNDSDSRSTWTCPGTPIQQQDLVQGKRPTNTDVWVDWVIKPKNNCILKDQMVEWKSSPGASLISM